MNEKWRTNGEMNQSARNTLLIILERAGIQIPVLEEAIERAYERYCDRIDKIDKKDEGEENQRKKLVWVHYVTNDMVESRTFYW